MIDTGSRVLPRGGAAPSGIRTPAQRAILFVSRVWAWLFLGLLILFFVVAVPLSTGGSVNFFTVRNSQNILVAIIPVLLLGLGQTFVIIAAGIDLSVGWVMSLASVLSALALRSAFNGGVPLFPAVLVGLLAAVGGAAAVGLVNGAIIAKLKVPAFIVTLGTSFIVRGVAYLMSENTTVIGLPAGIRAYGNDALLYYIHGRGRRALFSPAAGGERRTPAPHGHHPALSGRGDGVRRRLGDLPSPPNAIRAAHLRDRRQHGRRGAQRHPRRSPHHCDLHPVGRDLRGRRLSLDAAVHRGIGGDRRSAAL